MQVHFSHLKDKLLAARADKEHIQLHWDSTIHTNAPNALWEHIPASLVHLIHRHVLIAR